MVQEELASVTAKHEQVAASEAQARQQLAKVSQGYEQAAAAAGDAEEEVQRLSMALQGTEAQLAEALQKESQVSNACCSCWNRHGSPFQSNGWRHSLFNALPGLT